MNLIKILIVNFHYAQYCAAR